MPRIKRINVNRIINYLLNKNLFWWLKDKTYLKLEYKIRLNKKLNLESPETFNEKMQWLKINNRKKEYSDMVDKYEVKKIVGNKIGKEYVIPTLGIYDSFEEINFNELPNQFVMKCTHDSGGIVICKDKNTFDINKAKSRMKKFLKRKYYYIHREWPYKNVKPRIIIEEYIENRDTEELRDYKLMCFNGKVKYTFVCTERFSGNGLKVTFFDNNWKKMPFERHYPSSTLNIEKPRNYTKMIELAEKLSEDIPFVRIDFYETNSKIYFGEITFFPGSGLEEFNPEEWDYKLGKLIDLNLVKNDEK